MIKILSGQIKRGGCGLAGQRLIECAPVLKNYGITFPPLFPGTINIQLNEHFSSPTNIIYISQEEIDSVAQGFNEWWTFFVVKNINGTGLDGFVYRTRQNPHGDGSAELVTVDLRRDSRFRLTPGEQMSFEVHS